MKWRGWAGEPEDDLEYIQVLKNCPASWRHMHGDDRVRHCTHCDRNVYNLSNMTRSEALRVVQENEGRLCVRFYRRPDGTVMTRDCGFVAKVKVKGAVWMATVLGFFGIATAVLMPVYGAGYSPRSHIRSQLWHVQRINRELRETKDAAARKELEARRDQIIEALKEYVEKADLD